MSTPLVQSSSPRPPRRPRSQHRFAAVITGFAMLVAIALVAAAIGYRIANSNPVAEIEVPVPSSPPAKLPLHTVADQALSRVVTIEAVRSDGQELGTGWLFDDGGDFVTNAHVIEGHLDVRIRDRAGRTHGVLIMGVDREQDIAVLRSTDGFAGGALLAADPGDPTLPLDVVTVASGRATGHDDVTTETLTELHIDVPVKGNPLLDPEAHTSTTTYHDMMVMRGTAIFAGNSGGPLLDGEGRVLGIVTLKSRDSAQAFAIPIHRVLDELRAFAARSSPQS